MKKLAILCSLVFAITVANAKVTAKNEVKTVVTFTKTSHFEVKLKNGKTIKVTVNKTKALQRWRVEFLNACGEFVNVGFNSEHADGSAGFINDLANAVNSHYEC